MGFDIGSIAMQAGTDIMQTGLGLALEKHNDARQLRQQEKLQNLQIWGAKNLTDYQQQKQLEMWNSTGYGAQMKQLAEAGLNPGLLYGMKGGGGMTIGNGVIQPSNGGNAPTGGGEIMNAMGMGIQYQLLQAQKANIEADTKNKLADASNKGANTDVQVQTLQNLIQEEDNLRWKTELTQIEFMTKRLEYHLKDMTFDDAMNQIKSEAKEAQGRMRSTLIQAGVDEATQKTKINQVNENLALTMADIALKKSGINVNEQQIAKMKNDMIVALRGVSVQEAQQKLNEWSKQIEVNYPSIGNVFGRLTNEIMELYNTTTGQGNEEKSRIFKHK